MPVIAKPALYRATRPLIRAWWRLSRGATLGARVIVENAAGHVALVRHTYVAGWHLPGGGVERGERAVEAARREAEEETGAALEGLITLVGVYANFAAFPGDHVLLYRARGEASGAAPPDHEIAEVAWVDPLSPPDGATTATRARLAEVFADAAASADW